MNHMNYNWPNRGVPYPYPPSAPTTNASSNSQTAFPYQHQQQPTSSYSTPNTYTPPAGYSHAGSYNSAAPTYTNSNAYGGTGHHSGVNSYTSATASTHPNYSPAVSQRQQHSTAPAVDFKDRPTVAPGTPLSTGNNSSGFSRTPSIVNTNQQQTPLSQAAHTVQAQAQAQAQAQVQRQQAREAQQREQQQRQQEQREQQQAQQAQAAAEAAQAAQAARAEQAREAQREQQRQDKEKRQQEQRKQREQQQREQQQQLQREREVREQQLRDAQLQESPKQKSQPQQQQSSNRTQTQEPVQATSSGQKTESNPPFTQLPEGATAAPKRKSMGRLGDADVHQAFVEFRAKDTDKCMSAQCMHCGSVRAKNTSRQRQHLLECQSYLNNMRENQPNHPILEMAAQHAAGTPLKDIVKPGTTVNNGTPNGVGAFGAPNGHVATPTQPNKRVKTDHPTDGVVIQTGTLGNGWGGGSLAPTHTLPPPRLERDFQLAIQLNPRIDVGKNNFGAETYWTSFISGHWNGRWGKGTVVPGGQDKQHVSNGNNANSAGAVHTETNFLLQTHDHPTAFITVKMEGWRTSSREIMEQLMDPSRVDSVDPRSYTHRCFVTMETGDERYADLNTGMWLGSVVRKATEVVYDAYRIS